MPKKKTEEHKEEESLGKNEELYDNEEIIVANEIIIEEIDEIPELNESKHNTFIRLAKPRTRKVINALKILGNCSNKSTYAYHIYEVDKMFEAIRKFTTETELKFQEKIKEDQKELFEF